MEAERILRRKDYSLEKAIEILGKVGLELDSELDQEAKLISAPVAGVIKCRGKFRFKSNLVAVKQVVVVRI